LAFDLQPALESALVSLRPLRAEDFHGLYAVALDPLIWDQHPSHDRYKEEVFKRFFEEGLQSGGALIVRDAKDGRVIGSSRFHGYDEARREIEIGWTFLARSHWGGSYNREMKRLMLEHAFQVVDSVVFHIAPQNLRSRKAVDKIGGVHIRTKTDQGPNSLVYQITAPTFRRVFAGHAASETATVESPSVGDATDVPRA
jgi:RimJ/RimL family protein N-acetyltransferase